MNSKRNASSFCDSARVVIALAGGAWILSAFLLVGLVLDGSYYLFETLRQGSPFIPHHRWFNWMLQAPVLLARDVLEDPVDLSVLHALSCGLVPFWSLWASLRMLKSKLAHLRIWPVLGILVAPLPGILPIVGEITPTLQLVWVIYCFVWIGCPRAWSFAAVLSLFAMATLHPGAVPLIFSAAIMAARFAGEFGGDGRKRVWRWGFLLAAVSLLKAIEVWAFASGYERSNLQLSVWIGELQSGLLRTPFPVLLPLLVERVLSVSMGKRLVRWASGALWALSFVLALIYIPNTELWAGMIDYRKFGIFIGLLLAAMGAIEAKRSLHGGVLPHRIPLIVPTVLFVILFSGMALSWRCLCRSFLARLEAHQGRIMLPSDVPAGETGSLLNHWSSTPLSLVLQGWAPEKVFVMERRSPFRVCPEDPFDFRTGKFRLDWLQKIDSSGEGQPPPP